MTTGIASRTPEGEPLRCPVCGFKVAVDPSLPPGDAPCSRCGVLLWCSPSGCGQQVRISDDIDAIYERVRRKVREATECSAGEAIHLVDRLAIEGDSASAKAVEELGREMSQSEREKVLAILRWVGYLASREQNES